MIKLVLSDLDNTLLPFGEPVVCEQTLPAIRELRSAGIRFAPATGRPLNDLQYFFKHDLSALDCALMCNGLLLRIDGKTVFERCFDHEDLVRIAKLVEKYPGVGLLLSDEDPQPWIIGIGDVVNWQMQHEQVFPHGYRVVNEVPRFACNKAALTCDASLADLQALHQELSETFPQFEFFNSYTDWFDVSPAGWTKADGIKILASKLGLSLDEIMVFGDGVNDIEMFDAAVHSVAVHSSVSEVHARARYHIGAAADHSVAAAFCELADAARDQRLPAFMQSA